MSFLAQGGLGMRIKILLVSFSLFLLASLAWAQSDPGQPDTVYFCDNTFYFAVTPGDSTPAAFLRLAFFNDSSVHGITIPFAYVLGFATFDSVSYTGSRVDSFVFKTVNFDTLSNKVLMGAIPVEEDPVAPGRGLYATLWFTLNSTLASVSLDTTFFPPSNHLYFANSSVGLYTPVWAGPSNFNVTTYKAGDANNSGKLDLADVIFLANYLFKFGAPAPPVLAAADADGNCKLELSDVIYVVNYLFKFGFPAPVAGCVFPACN